MSHLLRYLTVSFSVPTIYRKEIPAFRGAIAEKVGLEHDIFHNHDADGSYIYRYPLIQYKMFRQQQPGLLCLQDGVDNVYHLFAKRSWEISMHGQPVSLRIAQLKMEQYQLTVKDRLTPYRVGNWQALNQANYYKYINTDSLTERIDMLERLLASHLLWFAKGVGWQLEKRFDVSITGISQQQPLKFKKVPVMSFDVTFKSNMFIPAHIGIGKGASRGLGTVMPNYRQGENNSNPVAIEETE
ncbi:hypothetical protein C7N43_10275 [Sphingobacteriales bacterium UPWRP_1]|nr:hypothetical protein C7N43_10275 [Sphingobacteriales bacterium UPWRP_1]